MAGTHLSQEAHDRLVAELEDLTTRGRIEVAQRIEEARALGDLSENGDYHAAKDDQGKMESRVRQITALLDQAVITTPRDDLVAIGSVVEIRYEGDDESERYLVGSIEEKGELAVISPESPLGKELLGKVAGDKVSFQGPTGASLNVEIVSIG